MTTTQKARLNRSVYLTITYIFMAALAVVLVFPYFYMFIRSFMTSGQVGNRPIEYLPRPISLEGWKTFFSGNEYMHALGITTEILIINLIAVPLSASMVAFAFAKCKFIGSKFLFAVMLGTMMLPGVVTQIPLYSFFNKLGWINTIWVFTVPNMFGGGAVYIFLIRQFMKGIPNELDNAAKLDGANLFQRYLFINLPLCKPIIIYIMVSVFGSYWGDFYGPLMYMRKEGHYTLAYAIYLLTQQDRVTPEFENMRLAAGVFMSAFPLVLFFLFQKQLIEGVSTAGLKG